MSKSSCNSQPSTEDYMNQTYANVGHDISTIQGSALDNPSDIVLFHLQENETENVSGLCTEAKQLHGLDNPLFTLSSIKIK